ncbi:FAD/NAD(P)-binding domain-containing protein [Neolentinus lepideus HHB14362 ss-1]|uniref:FAD/NAD(P)-binding domain-containing protein n=1 Tax=Neolentinus lepideus HHB14362 ss-1 TaxID=1314782 RepID=A0A165VGQ7_9AGAM|nr:FAD/NAD(P)-binding domain-containing protein [Neolentinus lepideus HHB14362 ss-1]
MVSAYHAVQCVLAMFWLLPTCPLLEEVQSPTKRVAIIGAGSGGVGTLKAIFDIPEDVRRTWQIDLFDQREEVGGVWLPQPNPPPPPHLPVTPLYPALRTNTPHPTMTIPRFPFPPMTELYPYHWSLQKYHAAIASHFNLTSHIHLSHAVVNASYDPESHWKLEILANNSVPLTKYYDHLIVANGHNRYPHIPSWSGEGDWLTVGNGERHILHSLWYREPEKYANQTVFVLGNGASGRDMVLQVVEHASKVYHSYDNDTSRRPIVFPPIEGAEYKPRISHFTPSSIVFVDNTTVETSGPTTILLGTGYDLLVPFLSTLSVAPNVNYSTTSLSTNLHYIRPLWRHLLALDPSLPTNALAFVGLPVWIANAPSDYAQGLFIAHAIADETILPSRESLFLELEAEEKGLEVQGIDPFLNGHKFQGETKATDYQNAFISYLRANSSIPLPDFLADGHDYVEPWRKNSREDTFLLRKGWLRAEELGIQDKFLEGAVTEEDWVNVMVHLKDWELKHEEAERGEAEPFKVVDLPM